MFTRLSNISIYRTEFRVWCDLFSLLQLVIILKKVINKIANLQIVIDTIKNNTAESTRQHEVDEIEDSSSGEAIKESIKEKNNFFV